MIFIAAPGFDPALRYFAFIPIAGILQFR